MSELFWVIIHGTRRTLYDVYPNMVIRQFSRDEAQFTFSGAVYGIVQYDEDMQRRIFLTVEIKEYKRLKNSNDEALRYLLLLTLSVFYNTHSLSSKSSHTLTGICHCKNILSPVCKTRRTFS
ncbi:hypothetical protein F511_09884 [Dorcoceras hygrometricum]|uniref:Uncharacterized protein n=1 Tax=Dorcoceras hygrometricum TaxID=472368 RepID=A0A2Z7D110_9LAMI|nr:hypothetical protein F511_09884 [Dorcoceras hygrometricum]